MDGARLASGFFSISEAFGCKSCIRPVVQHGWLLALMRACNVEASLRSELAARAAPLAASGLEDLVNLVLGGHPWR